MLRKGLIGMAMLALVCASGSAMAEEPSTETPLRVGFGMDLGVPSGISLGVVVKPRLNWLSVEASLTHNVLAFGGRLSVKLDPIAHFTNFPIGLIGDLQGGFNGEGTIPGHADLPPIGYDYLNFYGGLRLGRPNGFHWLFEVGPTYMHVNTMNFQSLLANNGVSGLTVGNPTVNAWLIPTFTTGFQVCWP